MKNMTPKKAMEKANRLSKLFPDTEFYPRNFKGVDLISVHEPKKQTFKCLFTEEDILLYCKNRKNKNTKTKTNLDLSL